MFLNTPDRILVMPVTMDDPEPNRPA
jgi:hypothetical protein